MAVGKNEKNLLKRIADELADKAQDLAPYRTGHLHDNIQVFDDRINQGYVEVGNSAKIPYASFVHQGTGMFGEHKKPIVPKKAKGLKTPYGYRKSVKGQKPNPYLNNALEDYMQLGGLDRALKDSSGKIIKDIAADIKKAFSKLL